MRSDVRRKLASAGAAIAGAAAALLAGYVLVVELGGALVAGVVKAMVLLPRGIVWLTLVLQNGTSGWVIAGEMVTAAAGALKVPLVTVTLIALEVMAVGALLALRTLLRNEGAAAESKERNP